MHVEHYHETAQQPFIAAAPGTVAGCRWPQREVAIATASWQRNLGRCRTLPVLPLRALRDSL